LIFLIPILLLDWFDTSAFANPAPLAFGNSPRSGLRGAPMITTDTTVEKSFSLTERWKLDLRWEFYNLFNHAMFNITGFTFGAADFGLVSNSRPADCPTNRPPKLLMR